jgi:hypothetical protein
MIFGQKMIVSPASLRYAGLPLPKRALGEGIRVNGLPFLDIPQHIKIFNKFHIFLRLVR